MGAPLKKRDSQCSSGNKSPISVTFRNYHKEDERQRFWLVHLCLVFVFASKYWFLRMQIYLPSVTKCINHCGTVMTWENRDLRLLAVEPKEFGNLSTACKLIKISKYNLLRWKDDRKYNTFSTFGDYKTYNFLFVIEFLSHSSFVSPVAFKGFNLQDEVVQSLESSGSNILTSANLVFLVAPEWFAVWLRPGISLQE